MNDDWMDYDIPPRKELTPHEELDDFVVAFRTVGVLVAKALRTYADHLTKAFVNAGISLPEQMPHGPRPKRDFDGRGNKSF